MKYYSDEFKNNIVKLYHNENRSKKSLANEYGVHPTTISHWIKRAIHITTANVYERDGAAALLALNLEQFHLVKRVMADGGYTGENFAVLVQSMIGAETIIAKQSDLKHGRITPQRWVVERSFIETLLKIKNRLLGTKPNIFYLQHFHFVRS
ncbi:hypothetical protein FD41_GL002607 [Lentilactobacillus farraginis DSM 18382 = JCM 14108]|uniref:Mobile element protein n=1 Tax=Lentilactobacillus farraginis DSM 18382 = JCM 14108 TaxID=1423743 RepID=X0PLT9_9LACO|nr:hypothetical protein FD41_GL002607 [Lentilactobacillus farraginis DSM 18382 = JCM 14108]GAF37756.1 mobile element protein [Lentilactobacillus farraginis DSM 18382 = JCM 14108]